MRTGADIFAQRCARCHGDDGTGAADYPSSIRGSAMIYDLVHNGRGFMPAFADLTEADVALIEAFLAEAIGGGPPPTPPGPLDRYQGACARCHGMQGEGTADGPQIRLPVRPYATWVVRNGRDGLGFNEAMPAYGADVWSDADLAVVYDWLDSFRRPSDGAGLYVVFCANCHGATGSGGTTGKNIRRESVFEWIEKSREGEGGSNYGSRRRYMPGWSDSELGTDEIRLMYRAVLGL